MQSVRFETGASWNAAEGTAKGFQLNKKPKFFFNFNFIKPFFLQSEPLCIFFSDKNRRLQYNGTKCTKQSIQLKQMKHFPHSQWLFENYTVRVCGHKMFQCICVFVYMIAFVVTGRTTLIGTCTSTAVALKQIKWLNRTIKFFFCLKIVFVFFFSNLFYIVAHQMETYQTFATQTLYGVDFSLGSRVFTFNTLWRSNNWKNQKKTEWSGKAATKEK